MATSTFYSQIGSNRRNSFLLAAFVIILFGLLGFTVGYALVGSTAGALGVTALALGIGAVSGVASYFSGDKLVLAVSGARELSEADAPQLMNVIRALTI